MVENSHFCQQSLLALHKQLRSDAPAFGAATKGSRHVVAIEVAGWSYWISSSPSSFSSNIVFVSDQICSRIKPKLPRLFHIFCSKYYSTNQRHPIGSCETQDCEVAILCGNTDLRSLTSCRQLFLTTNIPILCFEIYMILPHPQTGFVWSYQVEICF